MFRQQYISLQSFPDTTHCGHYNSCSAVELLIIMHSWTLSEPFSLLQSRGGKHLICLVLPVHFDNFLKGIRIMFACIMQLEEWKLHYKLWNYKVLFNWHQSGPFDTATQVLMSQARGRVCKCKCSFLVTERVNPKTERLRKQPHLMHKEIKIWPLSLWTQVSVWGYFNCRWL